MQTRLLFFVLCFGCLQSWGQPAGPFIFRHLSQRDGLLHSSVYSIAQDADGYMWIGSANGLQRYDGIRFSNFQKGITSLSSAAVPANIYVGDKGEVWLTCRGVVKLDKKLNRIVEFDADSLLPKKEFKFQEYKDEFHRSWYLGRFALYAPDPIKNNAVSAIPLVPNNVAQTGNALVRTRSGEAWVNVGKNVLLDERTKKVYSPDYNPIKHPLLRFLKTSSLSETLAFILPTRAGNYWLSGWDGKLVFFQTATGSSKSFSVPAIGSVSQSRKMVNGAVIASCLFEDSRGTIWAGTNHAGLLCFDSTAQKFSKVSAKDAGGYGVDYNFSFHCITEDREGNLWLGTDKGINIFHPYKQFFQTISAQQDDKSALPDFEITSAIGLRNGDVLVTTWGGGFSVLDSSFKKKMVAQTPGAYPYPMTWNALEVSEGVVWIAGQQGVLYRYQSKTNKLEVNRPPEMMRSTIRSFASDETGNVYMGLQNGHIIKWDAVKKCFLPAVDSIKYAPVMNMLVHNNSIWAATENGLLVTHVSMAKSNLRFFPYSNDFPAGIRKLHGLAILDDTLLIAGTKNAGLFIFNTKKRTFSREPALAALDQQSIYAIRNTGDGSIWFTSDYALYHYSFTAKKLSKLKPEEGRMNTAFSQLSFSTTPSGRWLTSTEKEVVAFDPKAGGLIEAASPRIFVTGVKVMDEHLPIDSLTESRKIHLQSNQNFIAFYFSNLRYDGVRDQAYYHRLKGVDKDWVQTGVDGQASYTNLSPGDYVFELKGDGASPAADTWQLSISAPFYATGWFRGLMILAIGGSIFVAIRRRITGIRRQSVLKQRIAEAEVSALRAQMNPHFIFNCLSAIDNMIETDQKEKATTYLNRFARLIRGVLESSKKTLVPLDSDMKTLGLYIELEQFRCDNRFSYQVNVDQQLLNGDYKVPPLVIQPYVENAIHHGILNLEEEKGLLEVTLTTDGSRLIYLVKDNGVGRASAAQLKHPAQKKQASYGMEITEERIRMFNDNKIKNPVVITDLFDGERPAGTLVTVFLKTD